MSIARLMLITTHDKRGDNGKEYDWFEQTTNGNIGG